jgi:Flp pilus assembly protein TadG
MRLIHFKKLWRRDEGQALAEFALILPVLFLLIAGIIEFGRAWNIKQAVTDAAREGARYTVVDDAGPKGDPAPMVAKIKERLALASIPTTDPPTTISITPTTAIKCQAAGSSGAEMTVHVSTTYRMGWVGAMLGWAGVNSNVPISSTAIMRNEC